VTLIEYWLLLVLLLLLLLRCSATVVIINGAAGLGKTRLLAEMRHCYLAQTAKKLSASQRATLDTRQAAALQSDLESALADANFDRVVDLRDQLALTGAVSTAQYLAGHGSQLKYVVSLLLLFVDSYMTLLMC
jgi:hypothetical protein